VSDDFSNCLHCPLNIAPIDIQMSHHANSARVDGAPQHFALR
jgi:hypothetical protein